MAGTDRHLNAVVRFYRNDTAVFMRSIRIFPMMASEREQISNAILSSVNSVKVTFLSFLPLSKIYLTSVDVLELIYEYLLSYGECKIQKSDDLGEKRGIWIVISAKATGCYCKYERDCAKSLRSSSSHQPGGL